MSGLSTQGSEAEATTSQPAPKPPTLSIEEHGDHLVDVKIDGKVEKMRLRDALQGVAHQRKVTEVTQDLAQYQRFFDELQKNPDYVVGRLREQFGLTDDQPTFEQETDMEPVEGEDPRIAALTSQIEELKGLMQDQEKRQAQDREVALIEQALDELGRDYGDRFDRKAVLAYAADRGFSDVKLAFQSWAFEQQATGQQAPEARPNAAQHAEILGAVAPGAPTATPPPPNPLATPAKSPMDAIRRAAERLGDDSPYRTALSTM